MGEYGMDKEESTSALRLARIKLRSSTVVIIGGIIACALGFVNARCCAPAGCCVRFGYDLISSLVIGAVIILIGIYIYIRSVDLVRAQEPQPLVIDENPRALRKATIKFRLSITVAIGGIIPIVLALGIEQIRNNRYLAPALIVLGIGIILIGIFLGIRFYNQVHAGSIPINRTIQMAEDWNTKGLKAWRSGDLSGAELALRKAIDIHPTNNQILFDLSALLIELDRKVEAIETLKKLLEIEPDAPNVWFHLGNVYASLDEWADAAHAFQNAVNADPSDARVWYNLGNARERGGDVNGANLAYREGISADPDEDLRKKLATALNDLQNARGTKPRAP